MAKLDHYIALPLVNGDVADTRDMQQVFDMLRYDRCYPISNQPDGWLVLIQPHRDGVSGGFTYGRWQSFGYRNVVVGSSRPGENMPFEMTEALRLVNKATCGLVQVQARR